MPNQATPHRHSKLGGSRTSGGTKCLEGCIIVLTAFIKIPLCETHISWHPLIHPHTSFHTPIPVPPLHHSTLLQSAEIRKSPCKWLSSMSTAPSAFRPALKAGPESHTSECLMSQTKTGCAYKTGMPFTGTLRLLSPCPHKTHSFIGALTSWASFSGSFVPQLRDLDGLWVLWERHPGDHGRY